MFSFSTSVYTPLNPIFTDVFEKLDYPIFSLKSNHGILNKYRLNFKIIALYETSGYDGTCEKDCI